MMTSCNIPAMEGCGWSSISSLSILDGFISVDIQTTTILWHSKLSCNTIPKTESESSANVLLLPFIFCSRLMPLIRHADGPLLRLSAVVALFSNCLARTALFVFRKDPLPFASAHCRGPSAKARISLMCICLFSAMIIISPMKFLSVSWLYPWFFPLSWIFLDWC